MVQHDDKAIVNCFYSMHPRWFTLYLSSHSSAIAISHCLSSLALVTCGVPQAFFLGLILYNLYIKLSVLSSTILPYHFYYMPVIQKFLLSFIPKKNYSLDISDLQSTASLIQSWMLSNHRTLNPSKTEFLLIGLLQQNISNKAFSCSAPCTTDLTSSLCEKSWPHF